MKLLDNKKCLVLSWDINQSICGLKVKKGRGSKLLIQDFASSLDEESQPVDEEENKFVNNLMNIYMRLHPGEQHLVLVSGYIPGSVVFEIRMTKMPLNDLAEAIVFEVPRHVPVAVDDLIVGFRPIRTEGNNIVVRVFAIMRERWEELLEAFSAAKMKLDFLLHPFLVIDPLLGGFDKISFNRIHPGFVWQLSKEDNLRHACAYSGDDCELDLETLTRCFQVEKDKSLTEDISADYLPCLVLAAYGISAEVQKDSQSLIQIPRSLVPERFRGLRILFFFMIFVTASFLLGFFGRLWWENKQQYQTLKGKIKQVNKDIRKIKDENREILAFRDVSDEIFKAELGNDEIIHILQEITSALPEGMWVHNFQSRGFKVDLTVRAEKGKDNTDFLNKKLRNIFEVRSVNKTNVSDGVNIYISLTYKNARDVKEDGGT